MNQHPAEKTVVLHAQHLSRLAAAAIAGLLVLLASAWLLPAVSEYELVGDNISELVLGSYGFVQTAAFVLAGIGTLALAYCVRQLTTGLRGSFFGSLLIAVYGLGAVLTAIFPTERVDTAADVWAQSTTGIIHIIVSLVSFFCIMIAMFVLARTFARDARWRPLSRWSTIFAGGVLALFFVQTEGPLVGLLQRVLVTWISVWLIMVAMRVRALVTPRAPESASVLR